MLRRLKQRVCERTTRSVWEWSTAAPPEPPVPSHPAPLRTPVDTIALAHRTQHPSRISFIGPAMPGLRRPSDTFSLLCRIVAEVTAKNVTNGNNVPLLFLLRLVVSQRNLAFIHSEADTNALATFINSTFQAVKLPEARAFMAKVYGVPEEALDMVARVKVCCIRTLVLVPLFFAYGEGCVWCGVCYDTRRERCAQFDASTRAFSDSFPVP